MKKNIVIGMFAHVDAGKTTLSEAILYKTNTIRNLGRVDKKDTYLDTDSYEKERGITIFSKQAQIDFADSDLSWTLLDTPGHVDFGAEMERCLQVIDVAVLIISGIAGIQPHTETIWKLLKKVNVPVFIFVNKMDGTNTDKTMLLNMLKSNFSANIVDFSGEYDLEDLASCDEKLMNEYLNEGLVYDNNIMESIMHKNIFPCYFGSALKLEGIDNFIEGLKKFVKFKDYPKEFGARTFKITHDTNGSKLVFMKITGGEIKNRMQINEDEKVTSIRVYSGDKFNFVQSAGAGEIVAISGIESINAGESLGSDESTFYPSLEPVLTYKLIIPREIDSKAFLFKLKIIEEENPEISVFYNEVTKEININVMGTIQTEVLSKKIKERFDVSVSFGERTILYKETIANKVEGVGHFEPLKHYAEVHLVLEPAEAGSGLIFETDLSTDKLSINWQNQIISHLKKKNHKGVLTGSALTDVKMTLVNGRAHIKHTEGGDFRQATLRAVRQGLMQAKSVLLEPFYEFSLSVPNDKLGRAMNDLTNLYCNFNLESSDEDCIIKGFGPISTISDYQTELTGYTKGKGKITFISTKYMPCHNSEEVIERINYDPENDKSNPAASVFCTHGSGFIVPWNEVFSYMHLELSLNNNQSVEAGDSYNLLTSKEKARTVSDRFLGTDEVDAIIDSIRSNSKNKINKNTYKDAVTYDYNNTDKSVKKKKKNDKKYLLVDGYNLIYAWDDLSKLARDNLDAARGKLLDVLINYKGMSDEEVIVVFDAYRLKQHPEEILKFQNLNVVYTKEAETADHYIEQFAHNNADKYDVRVVTSDGLEQIIIVGEGCKLTSSREFKLEIDALDKRLKTEFGVS